MKFASTMPFSMQISNSISSTNNIRQNCQVNVISMLGGSCWFSHQVIHDHIIITAIRAKLRTELKSNIGKRDQFRTIIFYISFALTFSSMLMFISGTKVKYYCIWAAKSVVFGFYFTQNTGFHFWVYTVLRKGLKHSDVLPIKYLSISCFECFTSILFSICH